MSSPDPGSGRDQRRAAPPAGRDGAAPDPLAALERGRCALLAIDMQNAFVDPRGTLGLSGVDLSAASGAVARTRDLALACRATGVPVVWTVQLHLPRDARRERRRLVDHTARRARLAAAAGSWDAAIVDDLADLADDPTLVVGKHRFGAFHDTRLDTLLGMLGVDALLVAGATANACVDSTLREAYERDYDLVAVTDCIVSARPEWEATTHAIWERYLAVLSDSDTVGAWLSATPAATHPKEDR